MSDKIEVTREELEEAVQALGLGIGGGDQLFEYFKAKKHAPHPEHDETKARDPGKRL